MSTFEHRRGRAIAVAAVLVVATVIALVQLNRQDLAGPAAGPDDPPSGVQLIYLRDPGRPHSLVAYDWTGARRGSIKMPSWVDLSRLRPAPDGSGFMVDPLPGDYAAYFDRLGHTLREMHDDAFASQVWSADGGKVCVLDTTESGADLITRQPGSPDREVRVAPPLQDFAGPISILACSLRNDTAILQADTRVLRVRLSTGAVLGEDDLGSQTVVASADGAYVAAASINGQDAGRVYRTTSLGAPTTVLRQSVVPVAFGGDGSTMLISTSTDVQVIEWPTAHVIWNSSPEPSASHWLARPGGREFAIALSPEGLVLIVRRNGAVTTLPADSPIAW